MPAGIGPAKAAQRSLFFLVSGALCLLAAAVAQRKELERHAAAQPQSVNAWRRLAEFRFFFLPAPCTTARGPLPGADSVCAGACSSGLDSRRLRGWASANEEEARGEVSEMALAAVVSEWLRLDPVSTPGLAMLAALERAGQANRQLVVCSLVNALDYGPDPGLHAALLRRAAAAAPGTAGVERTWAEALWARRRSWWPAVHGTDLCRQLWG